MAADWPTALLRTKQARRATAGEPFGEYIDVPGAEQAYDELVDDLARKVAAASAPDEFGLFHCPLCTDAVVNLYGHLRECEQF